MAKTNHCGIDLSRFVETITYNVIPVDFSSLPIWPCFRLLGPSNKHRRKHVRPSNWGRVIWSLSPMCLLQTCFVWGNMMEYLGNKLQKSTHIFRVDQIVADWTDEEFSPWWGPCGKDVRWNIHLHQFSIIWVGSLTNTNFLPSQEYNLPHQTGTIAKSTCPKFQILATYHDAAIQ